MAQQRIESDPALDAAFLAYDQGLLENARAYLDRIDFRQLSLPDRYRAESLMEELRDVDAAGDLEQEYEQELEDDDPLAALHLARRLADASGDAGDKRHWLERCAQLSARVGEICRVDVSTDEASLEDCLKLGFYYQRSHIWLDDEARRLVLVNAFDEWIFIRLVDLGSSKVVARISLRPPESLARPLITCLDGDRLWVSGSCGGLLELSPHDWQVLGWYSPKELVPDDYTIEAVFPFPGGAYVWVEVRSPDDEPETLVINLKAWRVERKLPGGLVSLIPLVGPEECRVVYASDEIGTRLYTQRGTLPGPERMLGYGASAAAVSPDGQGILFMLGRAVWQVETGHLPADAPEVKDRLKDKGEVLVLIDETPSGASHVAAELDLGDTLPLGDRRLATSLEEGLCFALVTRDRHEEEVLAISLARDGVAEDAQLEILYRFTVPYGAMLLRDRYSRRVVALVFGDDRVQIVALGREAPTGVMAPRDGPSNDSHLPSVNASSMCGGPTGDVQAGIEHLMVPLKDAGYRELELMVDQFEKQESEFDVEHLVYLCLALRKASYMVRDKLDSYVGKLATRHPGHPGIALLRAEAAAEKARWDEVLDLLGALEPRGLDDGRSRHFFHLQGLAFLHHREPEKAFKAFETATLYEQGDCDLKTLLLLTRPMGDPPADDEWGPARPRIRQVLGALHTVDRQMTSGEAEVARALLERTHMWQISEQQLTARLASIYLDTPVSTPTERFYKRLALARFCFILGLDERFFRKELVLPGLTWDRPRLNELENRIRAWLDQD